MMKKNLSDSRESITYVVILASLTLLVFIYTFNPNLGYLSDSSRYYLVGQSIAAGAGFVQVWDAEAPPDGLSSPLYPLWIAFISLFVSDSIILIKMLNVLFLIGAVAAYFYLFRLFNISSRTSAVLLPQWEGYFKAATWAGENLSADAILATRIGQEFYLYSARRTVFFPFTNNKADLINYLKLKHVTHIVSDDLDYPLTDMQKRTTSVLKPIIEASPDLLKEVYRSETGDVLIFEFLNP